MVGRRWDVVGLGLVGYMYIVRVYIRVLTSGRRAGSRCAGGGYCNKKLFVLVSRQRGARRQANGRAQYHGLCLRVFSRAFFERKHTRPATRSGMRSRWLTKAATGAPWRVSSRVPCCAGCCCCCRPVQPHSRRRAAGGGLSSAGYVVAGQI
ncbi:hypothetical protein BDV95DRAFT_59428 [Massariosphaeria phaeospora]|uniref:Uncharacterized protein n=1 Tax=Massariosphaeria phaeospora TaxID=100035 RepID=A0A7C8I5F6_9PLEO|nr:hypothetical protein BDV95DRAFT_59428 [Massariosphaeria phaeospora]